MGVGGGRERIYEYRELIHFLVQQKLTTLQSNCTSLQLNKLPLETCVKICMCISTCNLVILLKATFSLKKLNNCHFNPQAERSVFGSPSSSFPPRTHVVHDKKLWERKRTHEISPVGGQRTQQTGDTLLRAEPETAGGASGPGED